MWLLIIGIVIGAMLATEWGREELSGFLVLAFFLAIIAALGFIALVSIALIIGG